MYTYIYIYMCVCVYVRVPTYLLGDEAAGVGLHAVWQVRVREEDVGVDVVPDHVLRCFGCRGRVCGRGG